MLLGSFESAGDSCTSVAEPDREECALLLLLVLDKNLRASTASLLPEMKSRAFSIVLTSISRSRALSWYDTQIKLQL